MAKKDTETAVGKTRCPRDRADDRAAFRHDRYQWDEQPPAPSFRTRRGSIFMDMAVHEFDQVRWLSDQEIGVLPAVAARTLSEPPVLRDAESAQVLCAVSGGAAGLASLGRRFPLGDVCKVEVFGTRDAEECRFLWPPSAGQAFLEALRLQAGSFVRWVGGADAEGGCMGRLRELSATQLSNDTLCYIIA